MTTAGDDLEDGLEYDVSLSDTEGEGEVALNSEYENHDDDEEAILVKQDQEPANGGKKRKKTSNKLQEKKRLKVEMDIQQKKNLSTESSPEVIVDYINNKILRKNADLSALELSELYFNKADVRSSSDFDEKRNLDNLSKFITLKFKNMLPNTSKKGGKTKNKNKNKNNKNKKQNEAEAKPDGVEERKFIAIVSMSALRACDVYRATKDLNGSSLKIINKNKIEVDLKLVKTTSSRILCCTPGRLLKVLNNGSNELNRDEIKLIIVDNSYLDAKSQNIWDIEDTAETLKSLTKSGSKIYLY